jgi:hypothetical protein
MRLYAFLDRTLVVVHAPQAVLDLSVQRATSAEAWSAGLPFKLDRLKKSPDSVCSVLLLQFLWNLPTVSSGTTPVTVLGAGDHWSIANGAAIDRGLNSLLNLRALHVEDLLRITTASIFWLARYALQPRVSPGRQRGLAPPQNLICPQTRDILYAL